MQIRFVQKCGIILWFSLRLSFIKTTELELNRIIENTITMSTIKFTYNFFSFSLKLNYLSNGVFAKWNTAHRINSIQSRMLHETCFKFIKNLFRSQIFPNLDNCGFKSLPKTLSDAKDAKYFLYMNVDFVSTPSGENERGDRYFSPSLSICQMSERVFRSKSHYSLLYIFLILSCRFTF